MKVSTTTRRLESLVAKLQSEKQGHLDAVAEIDEVFGRFGLTPGVRKKRGRPRGSKSMTASKVMKRRGRRRRRGKFEATGSESILQFLSGAGRGGASGADIVKHWNKEGRSGGAYKVLGDLVKSKQLKKRKVKGERGSRYAAA